MKTVNQIIDEVITTEGNYSNHPADKGGPTRWGITEQVARAFGYVGDMRILPREQAKTIYLKRYWTAPGFDRVAAQNEAIAAELFDTGVNMGPDVPARFFQRCLNGLNRGASSYPDMIVDGRIGSMTLEAHRRYLAERGRDGVTVMLRLLNGLQAARYLEITEGRQANEAFLFGWILNRVLMEQAA